jgi:hypothetical protein
VVRRPGGRGARGRGSAAVLVLLLAGCGSTQPAPDAASTRAVPDASNASSPTPRPTLPPPPPSVGPTFTFRTTGSARSAPFEITLPGRVDYAFTGPGAFVATIEAPDGSTVATIARLRGTHRATTWLYANHLTGRVSLNVTTRGRYTIAVTSSGEAPSATLPAAYRGAVGVGTTPFTATGSVIVRFTHTGDGAFALRLLDARDGTEEDVIATGTGPASRLAKESGLDGVYAFDVVANGAWTIEVTSASG